MNITKGKTGNALTSAASDHVIAVSADIYDETLDKYQTDINQELKSNKVDKVDGKQLSTEDFTTSFKTKLEGLNNYNDTDIKNQLNSKVDKVTGKSLSTNDYTTTEKNKLAGIAEGAQVNTVNSVAGKIGEVILDKSDVGLNEVDNTADLDKPISTQTQQALNNKANISDLSNVLGEEVIGEPLLTQINTLTREEIKKDLFIDMWNEACGKYGRYNAETGYFELNGLTDIGYEEALRIYDISYKSYKGQDLTKLYFGLTYYTGKWIERIRTVLPIKINHNENKLVKVTSSSSLQAISFLPNANTIVWCSTIENAFINSGELREVLTPIKMDYEVSNSNSFLNCPNLEKIYFITKSSVNFQDSPKLSLESLQYLITNAINTTDITITVHPDVYAKITGDTTNDAYNNLTDEEKTAWAQLLTDAAAKQITFATV